MTPSELFKLAHRETRRLVAGTCYDYRTTFGAVLRALRSGWNPADDIYESVQAANRVLANYDAYINQTEQKLADGQTLSSSAQRRYQRRVACRADLVGNVIPAIRQYCADGNRDNIKYSDLSEYRLVVRETLRNYLADCNSPFFG